MNKYKERVSIILLNYNSFEDTISCFESLQKITYQNWNLVLVDNFSPDSSMNKFLNYFQTHKIEHVFFDSPEHAIRSVNQNNNITLIQSGFNGGYGHGNNIGIKYALKNGADYVLVLNNDTITESGFLEPMVQMCEDDKNIGIASGKINFFDKPDVIWFNGGSFSSCTAKVKHFFFNETDLGQTSSQPVTFITGCMWLIPSKVFNKVGFINEEYFMYIEDLEYCTRVLKSNFRLAISNESKIFHKVGGSTGGQFSEFSVFWRTKNMNKFIIKNISRIQCKIFSLIIYNIKVFINLLKSKKSSLILTQFKAIKEVVGTK